MYAQSQSLLSVENASLIGSFGQPILAPISFEVAAGDRLAIVGPSGAGKTTLLRLLVRLQDPSDGRISLAGEAISTLNPLQLRRKIVLVPQEPRLLGQTVRETSIYPLQLQQLAPSLIQERLDFWRSQMPVPDDWLDREELQLSVGQRQWVSILRGLMMEPQILLLDEPTSALDSDRARHLIATLRAWTERTASAVIMVSHQREWVEAFSDRVLRLERVGGSDSLVGGWGDDGDLL